ncbi:MULTISPECIES: hypothetical protein [Myxococcus]|uniref:hypothetical protein n=1 Tax=Myxococcus TaxID=32 RepID=UPI0011414D50|nr:MULTISPECIES: hypothetical protein [Myxococcus]MCK8501028.1 hypothetical protein [Myxococcus fulvus]
MYVSRKSAWARTGATLALALGLTVLGCSDKEGDDDQDEGTPVTATLTGRVTFDSVPAVYTPTTRQGSLAFNQVSVKPVRNATVQVLRGSTVLASATTDDDGRYQLTFTAGDQANVTLATLAKTTTPDIQVEDNTDGNAIWAVVTQIKGGTTSKDLHAGHGWNGSSYTANQRVAAPFAILDAMYTASHAFLAERPVPFPPLKVNWSPNNAPQNGDKARGQIGTSHFSPNENEVYVLGLAGADTDEFDSHVIVHEWGHFFEANLSRADNPGGPHSSGDVLDPRIAFGEGYGNALSGMLLPSSIYVDTLWSGTRLGAFGFDLETPPTSTDDPNPGVFSEFSIMRFLYDLHDESTLSETPFDQVSLSLGTLYDVLVGPQRTTEAVTTVGSFIHGLKAQPGVDAAAVDRLAAHYNIGAIRSEWGEGDTDLYGMYKFVTVPFSENNFFTRGEPFNQRQQNRYYVFTGNGRRMTVSADSVEDVSILALQQGATAGEADRFTTGKETFDFNSQTDRRYVLVTTGWADEGSGNYNYTLSISSQ